MKKAISIAASALILAAILPYDALCKTSRSPQGEGIIALRGLDPVMLVKGKEVKGDAKLAVVKGGFRYLFASEENKSLFEKEPKKYEIQLAGTCPVVPGADGDPNLFLVHKGKIYIFASDHCVERFKENPDSFINN
jgi:YHS domain-containing protein